MKSSILGLLLVIGVATVACNSGGDEKQPPKEMEDYSYAVFAAYMEFRPVHDKFMDSLLQATHIILSERPGDIDTNSLRVLLNNARAARVACLNLIKNVKEVDSSLGLKRSLVAYLNAVNVFYDSDYDQLISLMVRPRRSDSLATLDRVKKGMDTLVKSRKNWLETYQEFKETYGIETYGPLDAPPVATRAGISDSGAARAGASGAGTTGGRGKVDTANFPIGAMGVVRDSKMVVLRIPYTRLITTDSSKEYLVQGTYEGEKVGFGLWMKPGAFGVIRLTSIGKPSDHFLAVYQHLYNLTGGKVVRFADTVKVECVSMGSYADSLKKSGLGEYQTMAMNKLFFESTDTVWEAECYLNINAAEHWIELKEKDADYPPKIVRDLSKGK